MKSTTTLALALLLAAAPAAHSMPKDIDAWAERAMAQTRNALKDADSAKFRRRFVSAWRDGGVEKPVLCGELNARNSYGGYTGFRRFVADEHGAVIEDASAMWLDACSRPLKTLR